MYRITVNRLRTTQILSVKTESPTVKTFAFKDKMCAKAVPGQFLMLWVPGVDEIPLSILDTNETNATVSVAVKRVGEATKALHNKKVGDIIGVRGPFGNGFTFKEGRILMVGGGIGVAPLLFVTKKLALKKPRIALVIGAKTEKELLFLDQFRKICGAESLAVATEDGSYGFKGLASTLAETRLARERFDIVCTCGPEQMIRKVFDFAEKSGTFFEASLERLMRCAIGLCGSCVIGKYRVCRDGPVFTAAQLREVKGEFGVSKRDFDGKKVPLE